MYFSFLYIETLPYTWPHLIHYSGNHTYISWTKQTLSAHHKHYFALVLQYSLEAFLNMKREVRIVFMAGNFTEILQICEVSLTKTKLNCFEHTSLKNISTTSSWTISMSDIVISDAHRQHFGKSEKWRCLFLFSLLFRFFKDFFRSKMTNIIQL